MSGKDKSSTLGRNQIPQFLCSGVGAGAWGERFGAHQGQCKVLLELSGVSSLQDTLFLTFLDLVVDKHIHTYALDSLETICFEGSLTRSSR